MRPLNHQGGRAVRLAFRAPHELTTRIEHVAARQGLTVSQFIRLAVEQAFENDEEVAAQAS
jgi:predicted DNA-binding protein